MRKMQLLKLKQLTATEEMLRMAKADIPVQKQGYAEYFYQYGMHLRAEVEGQILKVGLFLTEYLALNATEPVYTIFVDKEKNDFIGYDHLRQKWTTAVFDRLQISYAVYRSEKHCDDASRICIQTYLGSSREADEALLMFQQNVRRKNLLDRHKRITDQWDEVMEKVPKLPRQWERWLKKTALEQNFIFYEPGRKGAVRGYCSWCEKEVPVEHPRHNQKGVCRCCHRKITYKSVKMAKRILTEEETAYLVQKCGSGFVVCEFRMHMLVLMSAYKSPIFHWFERRRFVYDSKIQSTEYYYGSDQTEQKYRWKRTLYNRQLGDIEEAKKFLQKWQRQLQRKLFQEDYELAKHSKVLRVQEMEELRKNKVRLNGNFQGRLLADVLAEDLMEVEAVAA